MLFLLEYDRAAGVLVQLRLFAQEDARKANEIRLALELERLQSHVEHKIVILDAAAEADLRKTHRRYFESITSLSDPGLIAALKS